MQMITAAPDLAEAVVDKDHISTDAIGDGARVIMSRERKMVQSVRVPDGEDDYNQYVEEPILLPQSTHSLLYTEPMCSVPFAYSVGVFILSNLSLALAMADNLNGGTSENPLNLPVQVDTSVRVSQYVAIMVGLLMEEEIPSSLYLLQMIPKYSLKEQLPSLKYWRFVTSALLRLATGYLFIFNMFLVVAQGTGVLDIFYDCLALQFLQILDNMAFSLAKIGVFGKRLKWATNKKLFETKFEKPPFSSRRGMSLGVKVLYIINLTTMFGGMVVVSFLQGTGALTCPSITVTFPDDIWQDAVVVSNDGEVIQSADLIYSYFNGVYRRNGTHDGLPVYVEQSKILDQEYQTTPPAEIKYCKSEEAWVFMHRNIRKSRSDDDECPWLLRSPVTSEYDILDVSGLWTVWAGSFKQGGTFTVVCSECSDSSNNSDCNFHGQCVDGKCICMGDGDYFGNHCEHKRPCKTLRGDNGDIWSIRTDPDGEEILAYDRPTYIYKSGFNTTLQENETTVLAYTGSRWFAMVVNANRTGSDSGSDRAAREFHAFWNAAYNRLTKFVSDPATDTSPIAVDFYNITSRGSRYGPLGQLTPLTSPPGSGYFECDD